jgi:probable phosphoglycerate mutase
VPDSEPAYVGASTRSAPLTLHLVRHGRTRYNDEGRLQGWCDSDITTEGMHGVRATADGLQGVPFVAAYTSPSGRTVATARSILARHPDVPLTELDGLREFGFGEYESRPEPELYSQIEPLEMFHQVFRGTFPGLPGGESGSAYMARVARTFAALEQAHPAGGAVLVVSHGVTLMAYLMMLGAPPSRPLANASVSTVEVDGAGTRTVVSVGVDPSGRPPSGPEISIRAADVAALEEVASWRSPAVPPVGDRTGEERRHER